VSAPTSDESRNGIFARHNARRYDEAIDQGRHTVALDSNFFLGHLRLGQAYVGKNSMSWASRN
jgi:hypothetical protein